MTTVVAFVSQKRGVGESTLARGLARESSQSGLQVKLADLDSMQKTVADWHATGLQSGFEPIGDVQIFATINQALTNMDFYDLIIIDGAARATTGTLQTSLTPLLHGGGQEYGLRSCTLPTHQIAAMVTAFKLAHESMLSDYQHCTRLGNLLCEQLSQLDGVYFNGDQKNKLPNIINVSFDHVSADSLLIALRDDVAIASGSACNSGAIEASHVLRAMGIEGDRLYGAVRVSFGRYTTEAEIQQAGQHIIEQVIRLRQLALE